MPQLDVLIDTSSLMTSLDVTIAMAESVPDWRRFAHMMGDSDASVRTPDKIDQAVGTLTRGGAHAAIEGFATRAYRPDDEVLGAVFAYAKRRPEEIAFTLYGPQLPNRIVRLAAIGIKQVTGAPVTGIGFVTERDRRLHPSLAPGFSAEKFMAAVKKLPTTSVAVGWMRSSADADPASLIKRAADYRITPSLPVPQALPATSHIFWRIDTQNAWVRATTAGIERHDTNRSQFPIRAVAAALREAREYKHFRGR